jgi:hypothetical protein
MLPTYNSKYSTYYDRHCSSTILRTTYRVSLKSINGLVNKIDQLVPVMCIEDNISWLIGIYLRNPRLSNH